MNPLSPARSRKVESGAQLCTETKRRVSFTHTTDVCAITNGTRATVQRRTTVSRFTVGVKYTENVNKQTIMPVSAK
ncbi:hypothetical protein LCGC14_1991790 [marine sediment metagenome]|uniref:Uncharacterized protein n=1 Tax=marine sediment metagenome TaxID=412755 RepID=A0A0F9I2Z5_9ZZZZ